MATYTAQFVVNVFIKHFSILFRQFLQERLYCCGTIKLYMLLFPSCYFTQCSEKPYSYLEFQFTLHPYSVLLTVWFMVPPKLCSCT